MWAPRAGVSVGSRRLISRIGSIDERRNRHKVTRTFLKIGRWYMLGWLGRARKKRENVAAKEAKPKS